MKTEIIGHSVLTVSSRRSVFGMPNQDVFFGKTRDPIPKANLISLKQPFFHKGTLQGSYYQFFFVLKYTFEVVLHVFIDDL